jgi:cobalt-precorrin-5B (C1)-methyltransferase
MTKLAQGLTDLHSKRGEVDRALLAQFARAASGSEELAAQIVAANTAAHAFTLAQHEGIALGDAVARAGQQTATELVTGRDIAIEIVVFDREGTLVGHAPFEN